ncbi:MAG: polymer-forming cytoskeletal protein [Bacteroidota bacterium]|nr:polymer-forming cytoskeletal protein [Bacteroidota bacterium]MDX5427977.1 polymer-forming cytoskeletal protein [Bacteroidota bacterium]MDX5448969.1 polymer-forming cytoskeletal protein [Bacteroidota bacterium]MDX5505823.1 polymer-forming cytoskeletal protein [Bacteroidota bacterium]
MITSAKKNPEQAQASNRILIGTKIEGDISSNGDFRIDGHVIGTITAEGKVVIGEKGRVEGNILCASASIAGALKGKAEIKELLTLHNTAKVQGDVVTAKFSVEPGAEFTGTCNMGAVVRDLKDDEKRESRKGEERSA